MIVFTSQAGWIVLVLWPKTRVDGRRIGLDKNGNESLGRSFAGAGKPKGPPAMRPSTSHSSAVCYLQQ
jgi:hypothetical protein